MQISDFFINGDAKSAIQFMCEHEEFKDIFPIYVAIYENCENCEYKIPMEVKKLFWSYCDYEMKKNIANLITVLRILLSISLLFIPVLSVAFYIIYLLCGISDMVDGAIARKTNSCSEFGAKLDTISDFIFFIAATIKLFPIITIKIWLWILIIVIALIKIFNNIFVFFMNKKIVSIHTKMNKITGLLLFILPFTLSFIKMNYSFSIVCLFAFVAAIQETYYVIKFKSSVVQ